MNRIAAGLAGLSLVCMMLGWRASAEWTVPRPALTNCTAVDGDTIRCRKRFGGHVRLRLNGIDAPELPGHCRRGRNCVVGDPDMSRYTLELAMDAGEISAERIKQDRYGRWIAQVRAGSVDLSCWQLEQGQAAYMPRWDEGERTARACEGGRR